MQPMNVLVIDGQGGGLGKQLVAALSAQCPEARLTAVGTNSLAANAMRKAGAPRAATGENATPFTMGGGTYARHFPYAVSFGPEHEDVKLPEFGGPMHGANEAAPIDKLLEAVKIYILALLRLEEVDF